jgi:hypothetical protein
MTETINLKLYRHFPLRSESKKAKISFSVHHILSHKEFKLTPNCILTRDGCAQKLNAHHMRFSIIN